MTHVEAVESLATERYLLEEMTELERHAFEEHFFDCDECAEDVRTAGLMRDGVKEGLAGGAAERQVAPKGRVIAMRQPRSWRSSVVIPWAAAATLAVVVGYQATQVPGRLSGPVALAPVTLRPATRGATPSVTPGRNGEVTLAVDLGGIAAGTELSYDIKKGSGAQVASGATAAPASGALLLMIPGGVLQPGDYVLTVRSGANSTLTSSDYRFTVGAP